MSATEDVQLGKLVSEMEHIRKDICEIRETCKPIREIKKQTKRNSKDIHKITSAISRMKNQIIGGGVVVGFIVTGTVNLEALARIFT